MIDWAAFAVVGIASLVAATVIVALFATGIRLRAAGSRWQWVCFTLCLVAVLYGIYLIVPALHV